MRLYYRRSRAHARAKPGRCSRSSPARARRWCSSCAPRAWPRENAKKRTHPTIAGTTVWQTFEVARPRARVREDRPFLMAYRGPFDSFHATSAALSDTRLVCFNNNQYSVAARTVGRPVDVRAHADRIVIRQVGQTVAEQRKGLPGRRDLQPAETLRAAGRSPRRVRSVTSAIFPSPDARQPGRSAAGPSAHRDSSPDRIAGFMSQTTFRRRRRARIANGSHATDPIAAAPAACIAGPDVAANAHHTMTSAASTSNAVHAAAGRASLSTNHPRPRGTPPAARHTHPSAPDAGTQPPIPAARTAAEPGIQPTTSSAAAALATTLRPRLSFAALFELRSGG